jgi:hypothetical protein
MEKPILESEEAGNKLALARHLIAIYLQSREGLKELGILRSERTLQGDFAEWLVAEYLGLALSESTIEKAFDAVDAEGTTYQIKSRIVESLGSNTSFDFSDIEAHFDYLIGVFFDRSFNVMGMIKVPYEVVRELGNQTTRSFNFRWNRKTADDPRVKSIYSSVDVGAGGMAGDGGRV